MTRSSTPLTPIVLTCIGLVDAAAHAAITCPNEFIDATNKLAPIYAYFGGVTAWGTNWSGTTIHSGASCEVWANLVNDSFTAAGFAVGTFGISAPSLAVAPDADTFSVTVRSPASGTMSIMITLREDDNADGIININANDDEWESATILLAPGTNVYNVPYAQFVDANAEGNGVRNFNTTGRLAYFIEFATRDAYPGGQIVGPVSLFIDHCGLYHGPQSIPSTSVPGDTNGDSLVNVTDLLAVIGSWGACPAPPAACSGDVAPLGPPIGDGSVNVTDLLLVIANWD